MKISTFLLQAFKKFQTTDCKKYLAQHDSFSTKVMGLGLEGKIFMKFNQNLILDNQPVVPVTFRMLSPNKRSLRLKKR